MAPTDIPILIRGESGVGKEFIAKSIHQLSNRKGKPSFREDLYYRINGFTINIPPLRERKADIEILILHFLKEFSYKYNKQMGISQKAKEFLINHHYLVMCIIR
ncbi:sigma 54-interacting transcriptional regulator [Neobacillus cucumis]|uniref:sigma 54-interacting transcriptional regulator n=1 Tax=Neobacillus cucumis TaxID=1740721 RepID=UPI002559FA71|nr:sigma 54-interacting transcriptional regulator [Neobacillus cucumis]